jgi:membrane protein YdbS with pleckstrin-like domain
MGHFAASVLNNPWLLGTLCYILVFVPIIGIWVVHKYGWQHWEPFSKHMENSNGIEGIRSKETT